MLRYFFILVLVLSSMVTWAESCPTLDQLHKAQLGTWQAYDADNGTPLSAEQLLWYEQQVKHFALAAYYDGAPEGAAQCYYSGNSANDYLNAYLAHPHLFPEIAKGAWQKTWGDSFECRGGITHCLFVLQ